MTNCEKRKRRASQTASDKFGGKRRQQHILSHDSADLHPSPQPVLLHEHESTTQTPSLSSRTHQLETRMVGADKSANEVKKMEVKEVELKAEKKELKEKETKLEVEKEKLEVKKEKLEVEKEKLEAEKKELKEKERMLDEKERKLEFELEKARDQRNNCSINVIERELMHSREKAKAVQEQIKLVQEQIKLVQEQLTSVYRSAEEANKQIGLLTMASIQAIRSYVYTVDSQMTEFANYLVNAKLTEVDDSIEVLDLPRCILPEEAMSKLVTRKHSRGVCEDAVKWLIESGPESRAILTGSPGIGKSWSLIYALWLLLNQGEKVLLASRKNDLYVYFVPVGDGSYGAKSCRDSTISPVTATEKDDWVLVDPREIQNDVQYSRGRILLAVSPNRKHFHNWEKGKAEKFYMTMCTEEECVTWRKVMMLEDISEETVRERFQVVGGAPRYIFDTSKFLKRKNAMEGELLSESEVEKILSGSPANKVERRDQHLATLFLTYKLGDNMDTNVDYKKSRVGFTSHYAMLRVVEHVMKNAFEEVVDNSIKSMGTFHGARFEDLVCAHLLFGGQFKTKRLDRKGRKTKGNLELEEAEPRYVSIETSMLDQMCKTAATGSSESKREKRVLLIAPKNFPIVDFVDSDGLWFNATININHPVSEKGLLNMLKRIDAGNRKQTEMNLYWCVPERPAFKNFRRRSLPSKLEDRVRQHVLWVPNELRLRQKDGNSLHNMVNRTSSS